MGTAAGTKVILATAWRLTLWLFLLIPGLSQAVGAPSGQEFFEQGNKAYEQGKFAEAIGGYQKAIQAGQSNGPTFYNLGNAYFKAGEKGRAIAAYREAEKSIPRDPGLRYNLQFVRSQVTGAGGPARSGWETWLARLTLNEWTILFMCSFWVFMMLLALREWRPSTRRILRAYTATAGVMMILLGVCLGAAAYENRAQTGAVVVVTNAVVRFGPLDESNVAFQLQDGSEITVTGEKPVGPESARQVWYQVQDPAGRSGWLKADQVKVVR